MSIVSLNHIKMEYRPSRHRVVHALNGVSLDLLKGQSYAVSGSSGSGKSTLLGIMALLLSPASGQYIFEGRDVSQLKEREKCWLRSNKIGIVVQDFALVEGSTALDNIMLSAVISGCRYRDAKRKAISLMERANIAELYNTKVFCLSGGQRQRVAICRALMNSPSLLLADEPTGALDSGTGQQIINMLLELTKEDVTVVIATHNAAYARQCNTIFTLRDGMRIDET